MAGDDKFTVPDHKFVVPNSGGDKTPAQRATYEQRRQEEIRLADEKKLPKTQLNKDTTLEVMSGKAFKQTQDFIDLPDDIKAKLDADRLDNNKFFNKILNFPGATVGVIKNKDGKAIGIIMGPQLDANQAANVDVTQFAAHRMIDLQKKPPALEALANPIILTQQPTQNFSLEKNKELQTLMDKGFGVKVEMGSPGKTVEPKLSPEEKNKKDVAEKLSGNILTKVNANSSITMMTAKNLLAAKNLSEGEKEIIKGQDKDDRRILKVSEGDSVHYFTAKLDLGDGTKPPKLLVDGMITVDKDGIAALQNFKKVPLNLEAELTKDKKALDPDSPFKIEKPADALKNLKQAAELAMGMLRERDVLAQLDMTHVQARRPGLPSSPDATPDTPKTLGA